MTTVNMDNLSKSALAGLLADKVEIPKSKAGEILNALFGQKDGDPGIIAATLKRGSKVSLPGFGIFRPVHKDAVKARKGTSPFTQEEMMFKAKPATTVVKFRVGSALKETVGGAKKGKK